MTGLAVVDAGIPGCLGRVLDGDGAAAGTCFQVVPGVIVTAWHVLSDIGATDEGDRVAVDPLAGGAAFGALVVRTDPLRDLAVLTCQERLAGMAGPLAAADGVSLRALVSVKGHAAPDGPGQVDRFLVVSGEWAGGETRDDAVPLGRLTAHGVVPGMSGAPVVRDSDSAVVGVVSGRYNSADGWLAESVWVARAEDLAVLLDGIADIALAGPVLAGPTDLLLEVTVDLVRLSGAGVDVAARHVGVRPGLAEAVNEVRRERTGLPTRAGVPSELVSLSRAGRLLGESFLPGPVVRELERVLGAAVAAHQPVRFGLAVPAEWAGLPWEALPGPDGRSLALHPLVSVYRKVQAAAGRRLAGPLRIVVAIASPDTGGGPLLDYEKELRNVLAAVRAARADAADVRVVPFATPAAIREELERSPAHVLHITGHGSPGHLYLEDGDGAALPVTADELADLAVPARRMPPVVTLAACYTDAAATQEGVSFAARLCQRGVSAVIATEASITDTYATRLLARVYAALAQEGDGDVVAALSQARRRVQAELEASPDPRDRLLAGLGEWAAVTVLAASATVPVLDRGQTTVAAGRPSRPQIAGLNGRGDWYFVGRRAEQRLWPAELTASDGPAGIVVYGIGGTGKTTLAAEVADRVRDREPDRVLVSMAGPLTLESVLSTVVAGVRRELLARSAADAEDAIRALDVAARSDVGWRDRYAVLRDRVLDRVPVLVLLDNFEDNLRPDGTTWQVADAALGRLLAAWTDDPGLSRLLVTCRYPFTLPNGGHELLSFRQLGPLSRAETMKLAWSLPALDRLDPTELGRVWRLAGGHPRSLEYLDALLSGGRASYPDVTARLHQAVAARLGGANMNQWLADRTGLDAALAETVTLAADDVLLGDLLSRLDEVPGAVDLLAGISVYREPVDDIAVLFQAGQPDPAAEHIPDRATAYDQIMEILATAGIPVAASLDLDALPDRVQEQLVPHLAELERRPAPPFRPRPGLAGQAAACQAAGLLTLSLTMNGEERFFVHRWTAAEVAGRAGNHPGGGLVRAHQQAATYWEWRGRTWPQDQIADVHDWLEARFHLLQAGDTEGAAQVTELAVSQLTRSGAWDQAASLVYGTLTWLPADSPRRAAWINQLGSLAQSRGDYAEAERQYQRSLEIFEQLGDQAHLAAIYHNLGTLAQDRGDYAEAERQYQRSMDILNRLGDQPGMASTYAQLGMLAKDLGDYPEAKRQYQRSLEIFEQLGDQASMAISYHELGILALDRGDYAEAKRQYQRSLDIKERLGDQAGIAVSHHELGILAWARGDYAEAERQHQRSLDIFERLGAQAQMANSYSQLGILAWARGDYAEAERQHQRSLEIRERLGDQAGMAISYHNLGILAHERGDYAEAERQYRRSLDIKQRLGNQAGVASDYHQLGTLAQERGEYAEAKRWYQRSLDVFERLGNQVGIADTYTQLGILEKKRGGETIATITWHVRAIAIRAALGTPQAARDLHPLGEYRRELGNRRFASLLNSVTGDSGLANKVTSMLDRLDKGGTN
jgi:tetratricopeptide (TPR) repeat protein